MDSPTRLPLTVLAQPTDDGCGPTALHAVYRFWGMDVPLPDLMQAVPRLDDGGTVAALLGADALRRGFRATLYTYNVQVFDPTWFDADGASLPRAELAAKLRGQSAAKGKEKLSFVTAAFLSFLDLGGRVRFEDLSGRLIARILGQGRPILVGLSATYLYRAKREMRRDGVEDDLRGHPAGHFVVLHGYDPGRRTVSVADPLGAQHTAGSLHYEVSLGRLTAAILLGVLTYDGNLLVIEPADGAA